VRQFQVFDVRVSLASRKHSVDENKDLVDSFVVTAKVIDLESHVQLSLELIHCGET